MSETAVLNKPVTPASGAGNGIPEEFNVVLTGIGGQGVVMAGQIIGKAAMMEGENVRVRSAETHGMAQRGGSVIVHVKFGTAVESPLVPQGRADAMLSFEAIEAYRYREFLNKDSTIIINSNRTVPPVVHTGLSVAVDYDLCVGCGDCIDICETNALYDSAEREQRHFPAVFKRASSIRKGRVSFAGGCTGCGECIEACGYGALKLVRGLYYPSEEAIVREMTDSFPNVRFIDATAIATSFGMPKAVNTVMIAALAPSLAVKMESIRAALASTLPHKILAKNLEIFDAVSSGKID